MFSISKELHPPTGVEMVSYCYFFDRREKNLVVAGANDIRVFRFVPDIYDTSAQDESKPPKMKLECMGEYRFHGTLMALESMALSLARDALLLCFQDAKLSIVEYDPETHDLRTISLHYFETEDLHGGCLHKPNSILRVDPEGRCAALLVFGKQLVIIPFLRRDAVFDEHFAEPSDIKPNIASLNRIPQLRSYTVDLKNLDEKVDNVIDFKFLHGYYEPTLVFIYEPIRTYVGRVTARQDTCALVAVSLNVSQKVHPCIWTVANLPHDCYKVLPVPKPIGGVLVMTQNCLLYLHQSVPPYAIGLNSIARKATNFPLRDQENVNMTLDSCQADFLSHEKVLLSLKGGELYVMTLLCDAMRSVRGFHFDKAASSVLTSCILICDKDYVFLGSRLGNSLLLRLSEKGTVKEIIEQSELVNGEKNGDETIDIADFDDEDDEVIRVKRSRLAMDQEEAEVYGNEKRTHFIITTFAFEVCDSLLNVGPCGSMALGEPPFLSEDFTALDDPDLEIVTTSGYGKNGALCVLQRSIRPQIVTTILIPGVKDLWTLFTPDDLTNHRLILVSQENKTIVLQTGEDINQVHDSGFRVDSGTIFVANLGNMKYIAQVYKDGIRLLQGSTEVQQLNLDLTSDIVFVSVADPYIGILTEEGQVVLVTLMGEKLQTTLTQLHKKSKITALSCYCDVSGLFTIEAPSNDSPEEQIVKLARIKKEMRDEEELLYGNPDAADRNFKRQQAASTARWWRRNRFRQQTIAPTSWLIIARETGALEILTLPDLQLRLQVIDFAMCPRTLGHTTQKLVTDESESIPQANELLMVGLGHLNRRPILFARFGEDMHLYEAYPYYEESYTDILKLRFSKIKHHLILRERNAPKARSPQEPVFHSTIRYHFRYFPYLGGYSGVFICGSYPHWAFMTTTGQFRLHPMGIDSKILAFAPFNNPNCPQGGFMYCNADYDFRICMLPKHLSYDAPWPIRKVPLRCTPHFIVYHIESKTYVVALSTSEFSAKICRVAGDEKEFIEEQKDERFPLPTRDSFSIRLFSPATWEVIPNTTQEMEPFENVLCLKIVDLAYEGSRTGLRGYLAVGTNYSYGEDTTSRGRVMIIDIIEVEPEPGQPLTKHKCKILHTKEHKGPVTALASVVGFLCAAVGQKLYLWQLKDEDLVGIAFIDTQIYIHQMISVKNLIYIADFYKSVSLLRFQETHRTLAVVSRDFKPLEVYGIGFLIDNTQLGLIVADRDKNLVVYMYQPQSRESFGGQRLIRKADFHLGQNVVAFSRVRCKVLDPSTTKRNSRAIEKRHVTFYTTLDGAVGFLLPISERTYRRLLMLQNVLCNHIQHRAALNPKAFRILSTTDRTVGNPAKGIIDGEVVWEFVALPWNEKMEVCKKIGSKVDEIVDDLMEIDRISAHF
ncbi:unnamed protein product [Orchesella dallaii]|uniref:Cleavage and polyadenylation specificity factor subunit 1 n=1 Tax=Orchesella dallaii TaxID=48710 RepID=A0ABP1RNF4_9HEXA